MLFSPAIPGLALAIFLHQRAEESVIVEPRCFRATKLGELAGGVCVRRDSLLKTRERFLQQLTLYLLHAAVAHCASVRLFCAGLRDRRRVIFITQIFGRSGCEMKSRRLDRHGANRIVGTVIPAGFVDRQQLHQFESDAGRPIDELSQGLEVANAQIVFGAQSEERRQHSSNAFIRRNLHTNVSLGATNLPVLEQTCVGISRRNRDGL